MRFSIIIPVYNAEAFLENCLNSVLLQDYDNYEILLINDGSRDSSGAICEKYAQAYPQIHYEFQENAGPSKARNRGIALAEGEYLLFLDSDDEIESGSLIHLDALVSEYKPDAIISSEKVRFSLDNEAKEEQLFLDLDQICSGKESALLELSRKRFSLLTHKIIVRRGIIIENNLWFHTQYRVGEDILMMVQVICCCDSFYLNRKPYYIYNYNESSIMRTICFERIWQTTDICCNLYELSQYMEEAQIELMKTTCSMLMIGFTKYYSSFSAEQKKMTRIWMQENKKILDFAVDSHPATRFVQKFCGAKNAFLLAGFAVNLKNKK